MDDIPEKIPDGQAFEGDLIVQVGVVEDKARTAEFGPRISDEMVKCSPHRAGGGRHRRGHKKAHEE